MNIFKRIFSSSKKNQDEVYYEDTNPQSRIQPEKNIDEISLPPIIIPPQIESENLIYFSDKDKQELIERLATPTGENTNFPTKFDPLFEDAARLIVQNQVGSTSLIQRRMKLGYNRAGLLMDQLEMAGIVGPNQGSKAREVKIKTDSDLSFYLVQFSKSGNMVVGVNSLENFYNEHKEEIEKRKLERIKEKEDKEFQEEKNRVKKEFLEREKKKRIEKSALEELINEGLISGVFEQRREPIPQDIMDAVWNRDGGKCVKCDSQENLEFDHIIPFSKGGANTYRNLQVLCKKCNIEKSNKIG